jgi:hypothetical protein
MWVGVSKVVNVTARTAVSSDGVSWDSTGSNAHTLLKQIYGVTYSERLNKFFATGKDPGSSLFSPIISSVDGRTWQIVASSAAIDLNVGNDIVVADLKNGSTVIVVVGEASDFQNKRSQIVVSYDGGLSWFGRGKFFNMSGSAVDGSQESHEFFPPVHFSCCLSSKQANAVCFNALDERFVVVGRSNRPTGPVVYSSDLGVTWEYGVRDDPARLVGEIVRRTEV